MNIVEEIAGKAITIADNQQRVYDAGKTKEWNDFWDNHQYNGRADNYSNRFFNWTSKNYKPKYPIVVQQNGSSQNCFAYCYDITDTLVEITFSKGSDVRYFFQRAGLKTVRKITCYNTANVQSLFVGCTALENVTFEAEDAEKGIGIGYGFDVSKATAITNDSLMSIINALETKTSGTHTMTFGATNLAKLTDAEKAIATQKGWTLA